MEDDRSRVDVRRLPPAGPGCRANAGRAANGVTGRVVVVVDEVVVVGGSVVVVVGATVVADDVVVVAPEPSSDPQAITTSANTIETGRARRMVAHGMGGDVKVE